MGMSEQSKKYRSLQTRFAFSFSVLIISILFIVMGGTYHYLRSRLRDDLREQMQNVVSVAALQVNANRHATVQSSTSQAFIRMKATLQEIRDATVNVRHVYTLRMDEEGQIYFVVDAADALESSADYGTLYADASPALRENFSTLQGTLVEPGFYTDYRGTWMAGYAPLYLSDGSLEAVLAINISAEDVFAQQRGILWLTLGAFSVLVPVVAIWGWFMGRRLTAPVVALTHGAQRIAEGDLDYKVEVGTYDETAKLAEAFNTMTGQFRELVRDLEHRVELRTQDLERRAAYLEATGQVSRVAASILDVTTLLDETVLLISERFDFYHAGIFLVDDASTWATLRAASSSGGKQMLARHHRLRVGEGIVGYVARSGRPRVAFDVGEDSTWVKNPDLPETHSEMALPLVVRNRIIGVLDVQSQESEAFTSEDISTLRVLADQVAVAIENARLFQESQRAIQELQEAQGQELRRSWGDRAGRVLGCRYTMSGIEPVDVHSVPALDGTQTQVLERNVLVVPLKVAETQFGVLRLKRDLSQPWTTREINFVQRVAQDVSQALENVRLLEDTRARAARESVIGEISARMRETLDVDMVLQTALREISETLGLAEVQVRMGTGNGTVGSAVVVPSEDRDSSRVNDPEEG